MVLKTNYFQVLKERGVIEALKEIMDLSDYGVTDSDEVSTLIMELESKYERGDFEAGSILARQYKEAEEYASQMGEAILSETDREIIMFHYGEIAMNLFLMGEEHE